MKVFSSRPIVRGKNCVQPINNAFCSCSVCCLQCATRPLKKMMLLCCIWPGCSLTTMGSVWKKKDENTSALLTHTGYPSPTHTKLSTQHTTPTLPSSPIHHLSAPFSSFREKSLPSYIYSNYLLAAALVTTAVDYIIGRYTLQLRGISECDQSSIMILPSSAATALPLLAGLLVGFVSYLPQTAEGHVYLMQPVSRNFWATDAFQEPWVFYCFAVPGSW